MVEETRVCVYCKAAFTTVGYDPCSNAREAAECGNHGGINPLPPNPKLLDYEEPVRVDPGERHPLTGQAPPFTAPEGSYWQASVKVQVRGAGTLRVRQVLWELIDG